MRTMLAAVSVVLSLSLSGLVFGAPENSAPSTAPAPRPLTPTVGVDIVKMTDIGDGQRILLFRWKDAKTNQMVERSVTLTRDTVIGIGGKMVPMSALTDEVIHKNKAVATVGPDMVTAVSLRVGREMIRMTRDQLTPLQIAYLEAAAPKATAASDAALAQRVNEMVDYLDLKDPAKIARVRAIITTHLKNVRDSHNAGFAPDAVSRQSFNQSLAAELSENQIEIVKDRITGNKVPVTFNAYHQIVPGLTAAEDKQILELLKQAREDSLDVKNLEEMGNVFKPYKTKIEQYLIANGHDWKKLYKAFTDSHPEGPAQPATRPAGN